MFLNFFQFSPGTLISTWETTRISDGEASCESRQILLRSTMARASNEGGVGRDINCSRSCTRLPSEISLEAAYQCFPRPPGDTATAAGRQLCDYIRRIHRNSRIQVKYAKAHLPVVGVGGFTSQLSKDLGGRFAQSVSVYQGQHAAAAATTTALFH